MIPRPPYQKLYIGEPILSRRKLYRQCLKKGVDPMLRQLYVQYFSGKPKSIVGMTVSKNILYYGGVNPFLISQYTGGDVIMINDKKWSTNPLLSYVELSHIYNMDYSRPYKWKNVNYRPLMFRNKRREDYMFNPMYRKSNHQFDKFRFKMNMGDRRYYAWLNR